MKASRVKSYAVRVYCALVLLGLFCLACDNETEEEIDAGIIHQGPIKNPQLTSSETLKIFAIGNSFTEDPTIYLSDLTDSAAIASEKWCLNGLKGNSASLQYWWQNLVADTALHCEIQMGGYPMEVQGTLSQLLAQDWDVITFQQASSSSYNYGSFYPYLDSLIARAKTLCTNPDVKIAWQQTWSYDDDFGNSLSCQEMYDRIVQATVQLFADGKIDILIPTGTAIQNARMTSLNTPHNLTRDGAHLTRAAGLYVGACTWFESFFMPTFGISVLGNKAIHIVSDREKQFNQYETVDVTLENRELCQQCAVEAICNPFETTIIDENSTAL